MTYRARRGGQWEAAIKVNGRTRYLGMYPTKREAVAAYDAASRHLHGQHGRTNERSLQ